MNYKKGTQTRGCMKSVMRYVSQLSKTLWDGQQLVSGIGCQPETAFDEFLSTKLLHHKDGGVMFYHMVQSFPKGANIDPRAAHEAARRLAGYFEGCEVLVCTHVDREHIHSHCIINSVNFETGKKVHMADEQIQELRVCNDQICEELGLPKFQRDEQRKTQGMSNAEYPWEYNTFILGGDVILIENDLLADALNALPQDNRDILLMYWFLEMADREIAERMNLARRTINNRRLKSYRLLKELMGGDTDA